MVAGILGGVVGDMAGGVMVGDVEHKLSFLCPPSYLCCFMLCYAMLLYVLLCICLVSNTMRDILSDTLKMSNHDNNITNSL